MSNYPITLVDLEHSVVIIGGSAVATRKVQGLLDVDAEPVRRRGRLACARHRLARFRTNQPRAERKRTVTSALTLRRFLFGQPTAPERERPALLQNRKTERHSARA